MADDNIPTPDEFEAALAELLGSFEQDRALNNAGAAPKKGPGYRQTAEGLEIDIPRPDSRQMPLGEPVVAPWLTNQLADVKDGTGQRFPSGVFEPLAGAAGLAAEMTGVPSIMRGYEHLQDDSGDPWKKAQGVGEIAMGVLPGMAVTRAGAPVVNALMGSAPRAVATMGAAAVPGGVVGAQESRKAADATLSQITPPDYMTRELAEIRRLKAAKQQEFNAVNQKHARSGPETQRQALGTLQADLNTLSTKETEAETRIRDHLAAETERIRKELPFRQRYPGAAETIGGTAAGLSAFLPFASTVKNRLGEAVEGWMMGRAANKADAAFNAGKIPEFAEAQSVLARRAKNLDDKTSGAVYPIMGVQGDKLATQVGLGTVMNFEGGSIPEQVDALAFPPGHPTREAARNALSDPDYYKSRALPAFLWGLGMTGIGAEAGNLVTPSARVPERVRSIVDRGSPQSIEQLNKIAQYQRAVEAAQGAGQTASKAGQQVGAARQLEDAAIWPAPRAHPGTFDPPARSAPPAASQADQKPRLSERIEAQRQQLQIGPETNRRYSPEELPIRQRTKDGRVIYKDPDTGYFANDPRKPRE